MNTPTAYARRARAARDAAEDMVYRHPPSSIPYTPAEEYRAARLTFYAHRCACLASHAADEPSSRMVGRALDHAADTHDAWSIIREHRKLIPCA